MNARSIQQGCMTHVCCDLLCICYGMVDGWLRHLRRKVCGTPTYISSIPSAFSICLPGPVSKSKQICIVRMLLYVHVPHIETKSLAQPARDEKIWKKNSPPRPVRVLCSHFCLTASRSGLIGLFFRLEALLKPWGGEGNPEHF